VPTELCSRRRSRPALDGGDVERADGGPDPPSYESRDRLKPFSPSGCLRRGEDVLDGVMEAMAIEDGSFVRGVYSNRSTMSPERCLLSGHDLAASRWFSRLCENEEFVGFSAALIGFSAITFGAWGYVFGLL
jgi:hypothetical protein